VHERLLGEQLVFGLSVVGVVHAAVYGTHCGALRLVVEAHAFGALVRCDVVDVHAAGFLNSLGIDRARRGVVARAFQAGSIGKSPLRSTFIDGVVGTFWFASPAVDAGVCNHNGHGALVSIGEIALAKITAYPLRMLATSLQFLQEMSSMLTETPKVDVERARKLLLDLAAGLQSVAEGQPQKSWLPLAAAVEGAVNLNGWFTPEQVKFSLKAWVKALQPEAVDAWLTGLPAKSTDSPITVGIVMAGNIPFVGLHDLICGVVSGHRIQIKPSRDDAGLIAALLSCWSEGAPGVQEQVTIAEAALSDYDAVIATGSRNSGRYFQHYFGKVPHIIRGQRTSVAVLDGSETHEDMCALAEDIFRYFGLGCRNVTQVFVPRDFDLDRLFAAFADWGQMAQHSRYYNNYTYHKALWLMEAVDLLENGFVLLKEDADWVSPVGALHYQRYDALTEVETRIEEGADNIQCRVGTGGVAFGSAQYPGLKDYADGVDTMDFLLALEA